MFGKTSANEVTSKHAKPYLKEKFAVLPNAEQYKEIVRDEYNSDYFRSIKVRNFRQQLAGYCARCFFFFQLRAQSNRIILFSNRRPVRCSKLPSTKISICISLVTRLTSLPSSAFAMPMWAVFLLFLLAVDALAPVKDFRVADMRKVLTHNVNKAVQDPLQQSATSLSSSGSSVPTLVLADNIQMLWTDESNSIYYINTTLDSTSSGYTETFPLLLDTGSGISWINNISCTSSACTNAPRLDSNATSSSAFTLSYSGSSVSGSVINAKENNMTWSFPYGLSIANYSFGVADSAPSFFDDYNISGIIGITSSYTSSETNLVYQLYEEGTIDAMTFGLSLGNGTNTNSSFGGLLLFGSAATKKLSDLATSDIQYCDIIDNSQHYWMVNISSVAAKDASDNYEIVGNSSKRAIIDTGTTGMALPLEDADELHEALFGTDYITDSNGNYAFLCNATAEIIFTIDTHNFTLSVDNIRASAYTGSTLSGYCASKVQGTEDDEYWILGASFLQGYYSVFDLAESRIGFAPRAEFAIALPGAKLATTLTYSSTSTLLNSTSSHASGNNAAQVGSATGLLLAAFLCMIFV